MKQEAPQTWHSRVGISGLQAGEHVNRLNQHRTTVVMQPTTRISFLRGAFGLLCTYVDG